ncbi:YkvA family protein [Microbacter sp. GSS18]|nr:YkvA family protein [Microbacter sp. GSS18]
MWWQFLRAVRKREHRVAPTTWVAAIAATIYTFAPIDLIPELVLGPLGFVDDLGIWGVFAVLFAREKGRWQAEVDAAKKASRDTGGGQSQA